MVMAILLRRASSDDIAALQALMDASVRGLATAEYTPAQIDLALQTAFTVDSQLIQDGTYFVAEDAGELLGCGGWSRRKTLCGGDHHAVRENSLLDPSRDAAKIRAIFVHPRHARRGIGSLILQAAEEAARAEGFRRLEMGATLTGVPLYLRKGYRLVERIAVPLKNDVSLPVALMAKQLSE